MISFFSGFLILMKKNMILRKRNLISTALEILIPIIFVLAMANLKNHSENQKIEKQSFIRNTSQEVQSFIHGNYLDEPISLYKVGLYSYKQHHVTYIYQKKNQKSQKFQYDFFSLKSQIKAQKERSKKQKEIFQSFKSQDVNEKQAYINNIKYCNKDINNKQPVALSPKKSRHVKKFYKFLKNKLNLDVMLFDSNEDIDNYIKSKDYIKNKQICFGVNFDKTSKNKWIYQLRFNMTDEEFISDIPNLNREKINYYEHPNLWSINKYKKNGFYSMQFFIDNFILKQKGAYAQIKAEVSSKKFDTFEYDQFSANSRYTVDFYVLIPFIVNFSCLLYKIINEKEMKIREGMKIMGMSNFSFFLSWYVDYSIIFLISTITVTSVLVSYILLNQTFLFVFLLIFLFTQVLIFQAFLIQVFFTNTKQGMLTGLILFLSSYIIRFFIAKDYIMFNVLMVCSLSPLTATYLGLKTVFFFELNQSQIQWNNLNVTYQNYSVQHALIALCLHWIFWLLISIYLDLVYPNEFGYKKHPLFFLKYFQSQNKEYQQISDNQDYQQFDENSVHVINVNKKYSSGKLAVNDLNLKFQQNEIFVLLGHNGAGKTTTIQMLNGQIKLSSGQINICGENITSSIDKARQLIGYCPQFDFLYDDLTVYEHLHLFGQLKKDDNVDFENNIQEMIVNLNLQEKTNWTAKKLSGGQRRRLSTGIAFMGKSKFVILDEPTSGLDTNSRRLLWDLLQNLKKDKIILLTTHYMDEAEYLGDKIGIMSKGQLKTQGSPIELKSQFGKGYNLIIVKNKNADKSQIFEFIKLICPNCQFICEENQEIYFKLLLQDQDQFPNLFDQIDKNKQELQIESYGLGITSLEEIFLKVTTENEPKQDQTILKEDFIDENMENFDFSKFKKSYLNQIYYHYKTLIYARLRYLSKDFIGISCEIIFPVLLIYLFLIVSQIDLSPKYNIANQNIQQYKDFQLLYSYKDSASVQMEYFNPLLQNLKLQKKQLKINHYANENKAIMDFDEKFYKKKNNQNLAAIFFKKVQYPIFSFHKTYEYINLYDSRAIELGYIVNNKINEAIIKTELENPNFKLILKNNPLPQTYEEGGKAVEDYLIICILTTAVAFIPTSIIAYIIKQKTQLTKQQFEIQGVGMFSYWISNFIVDYIKYCFFSIISTILIANAKVTGFDTQQSLYDLFTVMMLNGITMISFTYAISLMFRNYGNGQSWIYIIYSLFGSTLTILMWDYRCNINFRIFIDKIDNYLKYFSPYIFGQSLIEICFRDDINQFYSENKNEFRLSQEQLSYFYTNFIINFSIVFLTEIFKNIRIFDSFSQYDKQHKDIDQDVLDENEKVKNAHNNQYLFMAKNLRKQYGFSKVAVNDVSFSLNQGEVFGLLGVNGAGKTTMFKMLINDIVPTKGNAYINGYNITQKFQQENLLLGYCPQYDGLFDILTVYEHLDLVCGLQCMPNNLRKQIIVNKMKVMDLLQYQNVMTKHLSGGNQRKLQVAMAMLGNPKVIFLDEPSTGMDPYSRKFMQNVISHVSKIKKKSSIILTTHSMEEAEALCTKCAIMINGNFECFGSIQHIKSKFGQHYEIEIKTQIVDDKYIKKNIKMTYKKGTLIGLYEFNKIKLDNKILFEQFKSLSILKQFQNKLDSIQLEVDKIYELLGYCHINQKIQESLIETFHNVIILENFPQSMKFKISISNSMGDIFRFFKNKKYDLKIDQYQIKPTSLEQIFNNLSQKQLTYMNDNSVKKKI